MADLLDIVLPALLIGLMVSVVHAPLGIEVLRRGIIFIDLAIAQIAGLGFIIAEVLVQSKHIHSAHIHTEHFLSGLSFIPSLGALLFALLGGLLFRYIEKHFPALQEAWIGVFFVLSASLSILVLSNTTLMATKNSSTYSQAKYSSQPLMTLFFIFHFLEASLQLGC